MITILKASAGSGKTYNLAREYIRLLLTKKDPQAYRHILAVTFTNKATDEMKRRILDELFVLSTKPEESPYFKDFVPAVFPTAEALQKRASGQLGGILHDYSSFAVSTIDKFFQQTLRAFSREIGQFASYQVELDKAALVEESVDRILDGLTEDDRGLLGWLTENVKTGLENGNRFNLEPPLKDMAKNLKSTDHADAVRRHGIDEDAAYAKDHLKEIQKGCAALADAFVKDVREAAQAVLDVLAEHGVDPADSNRGFLKAMYGFRDLGPRDAVGTPTDSFLDKAPDSSKWFAKTKDKYRVELEGSLEGPLNAFCALFGDRYRQYRTACLIGGQAYTLGIAAELRKAFDEVQKEKNVLSIDDSNTILKGIIDGVRRPVRLRETGRPLRGLPPGRVPGHVHDPVGELPAAAEEQRGRRVRQPRRGRREAVHLPLARFRLASAGPACAGGFPPGAGGREGAGRQLPHLQGHRGVQQHVLPVCRGTAGRPAGRG